MESPKRDILWWISVQAQRNIKIVSYVNAGGILAQLDTVSHELHLHMFNLSTASAMINVMSTCIHICIHAQTQTQTNNILARLKSSCLFNVGLYIPAKGSYDCGWDGGGMMVWMMAGVL